jgi:hypothetical protein
LEVTKPWSNYDINKYYIITRDKETNEWKFFKEIVGHTVLWKDEPSRYGMTKSRAIEVLNIVKNLTNEDVEPETPTEEEGTTTPTEPTTEPETPTNPTEGNETNTDPTEPDTSTDPTEPSEGDNGTQTNTDGETPTEGNNNGETPSTGDTEPITEPETPQSEEPTTPTEPTEPQYKIITISSVTYNSTEVAIFDYDDYKKLKSTLIYINRTYPNNKVNVVTVETDTGKSIFYFYLEDELTWFLELRTNIDYSLVNHVTTLDDIKELL